MSREQKQEWLGPATPEAEQLSRLMESLETVTKHRLECWGCGDSDSACEVTEAAFARQAYQQGWRFVRSIKYGTEGALCPECAKKTKEEQSTAAR